MRVYFLLFIFFASCQFSEKETVICGKGVTIDAKLRDSFFIQNDWSYSDFVSKNEDGTFSQMGSEPLDTTHYIHTTRMTSTVNGEHEIRRGIAYMKKDTLILDIDDTNIAYYDRIRIEITQDSTSITYESGAPVGDNPLFFIDEKRIILQKCAFLIGDTVRGVLNIKGHFSGSPNLPFDEVKGAFKLPIKKDESEKY
jgi:hypothetical protein